MRPISVNPDEISRAFVQCYRCHRWQVKVFKFPLGQFQGFSAIRPETFMFAHLKISFEQEAGQP